MSDAARVSGAGNSEILQGHTLSPWSVRQYGEAELYLESRHRRSAADTAAGMDDEQANRIMDAAERLIGSGYFRFGMPGFKAAALSYSDLPFFLRLSLSQTEPKLTTEAAKGLITDDNRSAVMWAVLECSGFVKPRGEGGEGAQQGNAGAGATMPAPSSPQNSSAASSPSSATTPPSSPA